MDDPRTTCVLCGHQKNEHAARGPYRDACKHFGCGCDLFLPNEVPARHPERIRVLPERKS